MAIITNVGDVFQVRLHFLAQDQGDVMNVLHYRLGDVSVAGGGLWAGAPTYDIAPLLAEEVYDALAPLWAPFASNGVNFRRSDAQNISPAPKSKMFTHDPGAGVIGAVMEDPLPLQDAITILKYGAAAGRQNMGRMYVTGFSEVAQSGGVLNTDTEGDMSPFIVKLSEIVPVLYLGDTLNFYPVLYARDPGPPVTERITDLIEWSISDRIFKTMRSRRPGKGS